MMLSIVVPVLNEEKNIRYLYDEIVQNYPNEFELIFVDDGSTDNTLMEITSLANQSPNVKCVSLSRNFGHQNALMAGLSFATGEYIIIMDGDLQHPPHLLPQLVSKLKEGYDIIHTKRTSTENVSAVKKITSTIFYKFLNKISDLKMEDGVADFKAFNSKVKEALLQFSEKEVYLRGIFYWIGFRATTLHFTAPERKYGQTKYSFIKMISLGLKATTSFSFKPLRIAIIAGSIISIAAFAFAFYALIAYFKGSTIQGWSSTIIAVMLLGGTQLLAIGLLGEYISSLFVETKNRPLYIINKKINITS